MERLVWLGHAGIAVDFPPLVVIDPYEIRGASRKADVILVTHSHYDHCDPDSIRALAGPATVCIGPADCAGKLPKGALAIRPGQKLAAAGVEVVPAYNTDKKFHPKGNGWVGYIVRHGGESLYHAGDTDLIPEMDSIRCDVACLPVGGTFTMTAAEAAEAVKRIKPKIAVPVHYGPVAGSPADAEAFRKACPPGVVVQISGKMAL